jgi:endonuclease/exonuclease/phosphatase family metal-dependent hydrolase
MMDSMFKGHLKRSGFLGLVLLQLQLAVSIEASAFRVATYNVENYLDAPTATRAGVKSTAAKAKVCESIRAMNPDVLALEEMGTTNALLELRAALKAGGQDFPYWEYIQGADPDIHIAILSKLPILSRHPHTNDEFLLDGERYNVKRGFAEIELRAGTNFTFTLIAAHLKSRLATPEADESELRLAEARALRTIIDARLAADPKVKLIVLGDFNDSKNADSIKAIIGRGKSKLIDTRPAERNGDEQPHTGFRSITWTYYYNVEDSYSRIDYILLSPAMKAYWLPAETYIPTIPNWGTGSDHRPIVAGFSTDQN